MDRMGREIRKNDFIFNDILIIEMENKENIKNSSLKRN